MYPCLIFIGTFKPLVLFGIEHRQDKIVVDLLLAHFRQQLFDHTLASLLLLAPLGRVHRSVAVERRDGLLLLGDLLLVPFGRDIDVVKRQLPKDDVKQRAG